MDTGKATKFRKLIFSPAISKCGMPPAKVSFEFHSASTAIIQHRPRKSTPMTAQETRRARKAKRMTASVPSTEAMMALGTSSRTAMIMSAKMTLPPLPLTTDPSGSVVLRKLSAHWMR